MTDLGRQLSDEAGGRQGYTWHFKLTPEPPQGDDERLTAMVRSQLTALLRCITLTDHGTNVKVTGFRFLGEPDVEHDVYATDADGAAPSEGG